MVNKIWGFFIVVGIAFAFFNGKIDIINEEIDKQKDNHEAVKHYYYTYGYVPPYVLVKILTLGEISRLYVMLKQEDRQKISKEFKISDKVLKQILKNLTLAMIYRN